MCKHELVKLLKHEDESKETSQDETHMFPRHFRDIIQAFPKSTECGDSGWQGAMRQIQILGWERLQLAQGK